jgi:hypothetical protein
MQGRFTSPDAPFADQWEEEPQSWNLYSYVTNQQLNHTDPFGLWKEIECTSGKGQCWVSDNKKDTITSLAKILGVDASQLNKFLQNPTVKLGGEFDVSGFWSWRAGITPPPPAVVFVDLVDESEIPGDKYSVEFNIGPPVPGGTISRRAAQKLWNERGKIAKLITKEDTKLLSEFFTQGGKGKLGQLKNLKDFVIHKDCQGKLLNGMRKSRDVPYKVVMTSQACRRSFRVH